MPRCKYFRARGLGTMPSEKDEIKRPSVSQQGADDGSSVSLLLVLASGEVDCFSALEAFNNVFCLEVRLDNNKLPQRRFTVAPWKANDWQQQHPNKAGSTKNQRSLWKKQRRIGRGILLPARQQGGEPSKTLPTQENNVCTVPSRFIERRRIDD